MNASRQPGQPRGSAGAAVLVLLLVLLLAARAAPGTAHMVGVPQHCPDATTGAGAPCLGYRRDTSSPPAATIDAYVRPEFARQMERLRPTILAAAARHNEPARSGMSDREFAVVLVLVLSNEHNGWLEDAVEPLRLLTPLYQQAQVAANRSPLGTNYSIWPTNLRPSVAEEIRQQRVPMPPPAPPLTLPLTITGRSAPLPATAPQRVRYRALSDDLVEPHLAVEYLAANLERGVARAHAEGVPVTWRTLVAWHNQGIVHPEDIAANRAARTYVRRTSAYLPLAHQFVGSAASAMQRQKQ